MARNLNYLSDQRISDLSSVVSLTLPPGASPNYILVDVEGENVRYRGNGLDPTATAGGLLVAGGQYEYIANLNNLRFIEVTPGAAITVTYFKRIEA